MDNQQPTHTKPTKEQLDAQIQAAQDALAALDAVVTPPPAKTEVPADTTDDNGDAIVDDTKKSQDEVPEDKEIKEPTKEDEQEIVEDKGKTKDEPDSYKKKFADSFKESQKLYQNSAKVNEAIQQGLELAPPTDEEMEQEYSKDTWEMMDDVTRKLAKENALNRKRFGLIQQASLEQKNIQDWNVKVEEYVDNPETLVAHPDLEGKTEDFKVFAADKMRRGVAFETLVPAFLYAETQKPKPNNKGKKMFETPSGGPNDKPKPKSDKVGAQEAAVLMKTNYNKYRDLLKAGKIDLSVE